MSKPTRYNVLEERKLTSVILSRRVNFISVWPGLVSMLVPLPCLKASAEVVQGTLSTSHGHISPPPYIGRSSGRSTHARENGTRPGLSQNEFDHVTAGACAYDGSSSPITPGSGSVVSYRRMLARAMQLLIPGRSEVS